MLDLVKASEQDYNYMRRSQVKDVEINGQIVSKLVKLGTNSKKLPDEDVFDELNELHISSGYSGRNNMKRACCEKF